MLLAVVSLLLLIYFIHPIASSMQADLVVQSVAKDIDKSLRALFVSADDPPQPEQPVTTHDATAKLCCMTSGYLQGIDENDLLQVAQTHDLPIEVLRRPGHYLTPGLCLVQVIGRESVSPEITNRILRAFIIGGYRTPEQDPEFGIFQLVEMALRALSPGINDPFTAMTCIDHLSGLLASVGGAPERPPVRCDAAGVPRLLMDEITFEDLVEAAFNQIRQSAVGNAAPSIRMLEAMARIAEVTPDSGRSDALRKQADQLYESNRHRLSAIDQQALEERYQTFCELLKNRAIGNA